MGDTVSFTLTVEMQFGTPLMCMEYTNTAQVNGGGQVSRRRHAVSGVQIVCDLFLGAFLLLQTDPDTSNNENGVLVEVCPPTSDLSLTKVVDQASVMCVLGRRGRQ